MEGKIDKRNKKRPNNKFHQERNKTDQDKKQKANNKIIRGSSNISKSVCFVHPSTRRDSISLPHQEKT
jgi:hypothetical protein